ncbi:MAG TPA: deoxyribose-phosphate aldolase [Acidimicrobiales bacterium]|nr:deoxyribose-phosphate aldolase [Acidimicrobiales bacterium]
MRSRRSVRGCECLRQARRCTAGGDRTAGGRGRRRWYGHRLSPRGTTTATKVAESQGVVELGATELDMVLNIGWLRGGHTQEVLADIRAVVEVGHEAGVLVKVILENAYLSDAEKVAACHLVEEAGADFVKTSTGFATSGATLADIMLMRASVGPSVGVKAAGGVRTLDTLLAMVSEGATRFGATAISDLLDEAAKRQADRTLVVPAPPGG